MTKPATAHLEIKMAKVHRKNAARMMILWPLLSFVVFPVVAMAQVEWAKGFDAALRQAAGEKKFVILDISASY